MKRRVRSILMDAEDPSKSSHNEEDDTTDLPCAAKQKERMTRALDNTPYSIPPNILRRRTEESGDSNNVNDKNVESIHMDDSCISLVKQSDSNPASEPFMVPQHPSRRQSYRYSTGNISSDVLMGSMEFDESEPSFAVDDGVVLPDDLKNPNRASNEPGDASSCASGMSAALGNSKSSDYSNSAEKRRAKQQKRQLAIGETESTALHHTRSLLFLLITGIAMIGSITICMITLGEEVKAFENDFQALSTNLLQHLQGHLYQQLQSLDTLSHEITVLVENQVAVGGTNSNNTRRSLSTPGSQTVGWPFVTIRQSSFMLERYLSLSNAAMIQIHPLVTAPLQTQWEEFSVLSQDWMYVFAVFVFSSN
jgi:hypothetical protein